MTYVTAADLNSVPLDTMRRILAGPPEEAAQWILAAAQLGDAEAQAVYGQLLLDGRGVERDPAEAVRWFNRAARADHAMAMNMLGRCYEHGWGVERSSVIASHWYHLAAQQGLDWGMYNYATQLMLARDSEQHRAQALEWFRKAADLGHAKSINILGGFYEDGWEVPVDLGIAFDCYRRAAQGGDFRGQFNYARLLAGSGQIEAALHWLKQVPLTATEAFLSKMIEFLAQSQIPEMRAFATQLSAARQLTVAPAQTL